ncbi:hypothetical protein WJX74_009301 [Apatococcus lobatus]|uniref:Uncharacterized protein n=2 Tax=Apatococcus TaxID=904362 RepID=A0AAW1SRA3_9CHLO
MPLDFELPPPLTLDQSGSCEASQKQDAGVSGSVKKGQPWSEAEHLQFLAGLKKLGKGNWRGISRHFLNGSRSPTQVASHAQKHFLRLHGHCKRKSRFSSLEQAACAHGLLSPSDVATATNNYCSWTYPFCGIPEYSTAALLSASVPPAPFLPTLGTAGPASAEGVLPAASSNLASSLPIAPLSISCPVEPAPLKLSFPQICRPQASYASESQDTHDLQQGFSEEATCKATGSHTQILQQSARSAFRALGAAHPAEGQA